MKQHKFFQTTTLHLKKKLFLLCGFIMVASISCKNDDLTENPTTPPPDSVPSSSEKFTLSSINSEGNTLVTMGIPFAPGALDTTDKIRIFGDSGKELNIFVKPTLEWHFKEAPNNTIRAVKIQFYVNMQTKDEKGFSWDISQMRDTSQDIDELPLSESLFPSTSPGKAGVDIPRIIAIHNPDYLVKSELIPSYKPETNDNHQIYESAQFNWAKELDFESSTQANWLFDRPTSLYKMAMSNGQVDYYLEAIHSYQYWKNNLITDGQPMNPECAGGLIINGTTINKGCDTKYLYLEPVKIHTALTGIDEIYSNRGFLKKMSDLADETWWQGDNTDVYDVDESFTERSAGITLLAKINAYELLPEYANSIANNINTRIDVLYNMQQSNPDGFDFDGTFRHSWSRHEGAAYPGNDPNDRRFSPWMSENIADALWHQYQIDPSDKIKKILLELARGVLKWGFVNSKGYIEKFGNSLNNLPNSQGWTNGCSNELENNYKPIVLYSASSTADAQSLIATQNSDGWYSDSHNPETILILAMGYHFTEDPTEKAEFKELIQAIHDSYFTSTCGNISNTKRLFNWTNRSNSWRTYLSFK